MDGSSSSVSSMSSGSKSSRRPKIIGGIIGGAVGLVLLLLSAHCIVLAVRRKRQRAPRRTDLALHDPEKTAKNIHTEFCAPRGGSPPLGKNPKNLSISTEKLPRAMARFMDTRPLPREPRSAPSFAHERPLTENSKALAEPTSAGGRPRHGYGSSSIDAAFPEASQRVLASQRALASPRILQALGTPQPPPPRKMVNGQPSSADPFDWTHD